MRKGTPGKHAPIAVVQRGYNTNLASEFFVLSMLYRLGFDANLTLGTRNPWTSLSCWARGVPSPLMSRPSQERWIG